MSQVATAQVRLKSSNTESLSADKTLTVSDPSLQFLDANGAGRNVDLPAEEASGADGLVFVLVNTTGAAFDLTVRNDAAGTIITVSQNEAGIVFCDGASWKGLVAGIT